MLPGLFEGDEGRVTQGDLEAICRLFKELFHLVPQGTTVYCIVDNRSTYERSGVREHDYGTVLDTLEYAVNAPDSLANFLLILTSPAVSRWLDPLLPRHKMSLRK